MSGLYDRLNEKQKTPAKTVNNTSPPKMLEDKSDITISTYDDITSDPIHEAIRKAVKDTAKENTNYRFTTPEKVALEDLVYHFKRRNLKTNENQIVRIALNQILGDYYE